ncbi:hypothetical protein MMC11_009033, partial [Xylographa trunciseda]|nr:hypothetical protein [Xylographa trunciseda]
MQRFSRWRVANELSASDSPPIPIRAEEYSIRKLVGGDVDILLAILVGERLAREWSVRNIRGVGNSGKPEALDRLLQWGSSLFRVDGVRGVIA